MKWIIRIYSTVPWFCCRGTCYKYGFIFSNVNRTQFCFTPSITERRVKLRYSNVKPLLVCGQRKKSFKFSYRDKTHLFKRTNSIYPHDKRIKTIKWTFLIAQNWKVRLTSLWFTLVLYRHRSNTYLNVIRGKTYEYLFKMHVDMVNW